MGVGLLKSSVEKILHPEAVDGSPLVIAILVVSICVKVYMYLYNRSIGKKIDSAAMKATAARQPQRHRSHAGRAGHHADCPMHQCDDRRLGAVYWWRSSSYIPASVRPRTHQPFVGPKAEEAFVGQIEQIVMAHPEVQGMHDLIVHNYGPGRVMISLHAEVPAHGDILMLHDAIDNIECELKERLKCDAVIHMDPIVTDDPAVNALKEKVVAQVQAIDPALSIHDFRVVAGPTHTNVIFDLELPYHFYLKEETVVQQLKDFISELEGHRYFAVIQVDHSYVGGAHKAPEKQEST